MDHCPADRLNLAGGLHPMTSSNSKKTSTSKQARFETLESRLVLSAQGLTDLPDVTMDIAVDQQIETTAVTLDSVHDQTGVNHVYEDYGFDGEGQTVVVIDSGIAWDHYALGGGYGEGYKVVGGWDFAENDADPFDDPGAGYHGTHVSGIIGSTDSVHRGVSSGVDLVSLRVFDDAGNGSLAWVEQALQWVHDHKSDFDNPITTVNLSLGTNWNADNLPAWATLEEEFAQLEADGIFISVAAGNSFQAYQETGLSYPAVSDHVVPVASHDGDGNMSDFSQRNERVLVAPGESIKSTVPGHLTGDAVSSKFIGASGTSMAAPYVAGSSVLIRQAMEFMGYDNIDQATIYQKLQDTSDKIFDSLTGLNYNKINLQKAMESIIADQHGDTAASATHIGTLYGNEKLTGTIGTFNDVDVISFQAGRTGQMTFTFSQTHDLQLAMQSLGHAATVSGNTLVMDVVAGQNYTLQLSTNAGIGHYTIDATIVTETIDASGLGTIYAKTVNTNVSGTQWFSATAGRSGQFAFQYTAASQSATFEVYDAQQRLLGTAESVNGKLQLNLDVHKNQQLTIKITDQGSGTLAMQNLVSHNGGNLVVHGNNLDNQIQVVDGQTISIRVDGFDYSFQRSTVNRMFIYAHGGDNQLEVTHTVGSETVHMMAKQVYSFGSGYRFYGNNLQQIQYNGTANDQVFMIGTTGDDTFVGGWDQSQMTGDQYDNRVSGVNQVIAIGQGGNDTATLNGSQANEHVASGVGQTTMTWNQHKQTAIGFESVTVQAGGGTDQLIAHGSNADEVLQVTESQSRFDSQSLQRTFVGFESAQYFGGGGDDAATLNGGSSGNAFYAYADHSIYNSGQKTNFLQGFDRTNAYGGAGDIAMLYDSAGDDHYMADLGWAQMSGNGYQNQALGFGTIIGRSSSGNDSASLSSSMSNANLAADTYRTTISAGNYQVRSVGFAAVQVAAYGVNSTATITASSHSDSLVVSASHLELYGSASQLNIIGFTQVTVDGNGGLDDAVFQQLGQDESLTYGSNSIQRSGGEMDVVAIGFQSLGTSALGSTLDMEQEHAIVDQLFSQQ